MNPWKIAAALLAATIATPALLPRVMPQAHASSSSVRAKLAGRWLEMNPDSPGDTKIDGDLYTFRRDGTYLFTAGRAKRSGGNVSHSGTWRVTGGGTTLRLHATRRTVLERRRPKTLRANTLFVMTLAGPFPGGTVRINGQEFGDLKFD